MKKLLLLFLMTGAAMAQSATTTTYTGVMTDLSQQVITSGQVTFTLTPSTDSTLPGVGRFIPSTISCNINADGTLSGFVAGAVSGPCVVTRNTAISPGGTAYRICIQANYQAPGSCWYDYATTSTKDISTPAPTLQTGPLNYNGVPGPPGCVLGTTCTSSLTPLSVGGVLYADQCSGTDIGTRIMSCLAKLPIASSGYKVGTIILPNTTTEPSQAAWTTKVVLGPGVNLLGQGMLASYFVCSASGACLQHDASSTTGGPSAHSILPNTVYQGFTILGNGSANQDIFDFLDAQGVTVRDIAADGGSGAGSSCFHFEDINWFTERNTFINVSSLLGCNIGWRFTASATNPFQPHPSFGYNRFLDIKANPNGPQTAFSFEDNSFAYNSTYRITVNKSGAGATVINMQGNAEFFENELHLFGEENGTGGYFLNMTSATNQFTYTGELNFGTVSGGTTYNITPGATFAHWGDEGGFGPAIPTSFANGLNWANPILITSGSDLNTLINCGIYSGTGLIDTPTFVGPSFVKVETLCSGNGGYITQNAYLTAFSTSQQTRQWQRLRDNGVWGSWREVQWVDMTLSGTTTALPSVAIAAGACTTLTANVASATTDMAIVVTPAHSPQMDIGLHWDTAYADNGGHVIVPVCNTTAAPITPSSTPIFNVRVIQ